MLTLGLNLGCLTALLDHLVGDSTYDHYRLSDRRTAWCPKNGPICRCALSIFGCLILLDGFDEIASQEDRQRVAQWVQQQMIAYGGNRFVITSRPLGYQSNPLEHVAELAVRRSGELAMAEVLQPAQMLLMTKNVCAQAQLVPRVERLQLREPYVPVDTIGA